MSSAQQGNGDMDQAVRIYNHVFNMITEGKQRIGDPYTVCQPDDESYSNTESEIETPLLR